MPQDSIFVRAIWDDEAKVSLDALSVESFGEALRGVIEQFEIEAIRSRGHIYLKGLAIAG